MKSILQRVWARSAHATTIFARRLVLVVWGRAGERDVYR